MKSLTLLTKPVPVNQKYGIINGRNLLTKKYRDTKEALKWEIQAGWSGDPITEPLAINILQYFGDNRRRDIDAYIKILLDAMEGIVYDNDNQIIEMHVYKTVDKENPRTIVQIV